ncbi:MAG: NTP transferase domain-containing protein [Pseudomonadales bacterium]|nr:NTP transferase domain-containing protein [Pseudomonadales bacterium]
MADNRSLPTPTLAKLMASFETEITGVLLCGGQGRRLGHQNKPLLEKDGRAMFRQILDAHRSHLLAWLVSANRDLDLYRTAGHRVIADAAGSVGPLSGIATAATQADTPWLYVLAGDSPQLDPSILTLLAKHRGGHSALVAQNDRDPPRFPLLVKTDVAARLRDNLLGGSLSLGGWLASIGALSISVPPTSSLGTNVNTPEDLARWRALEKSHET